MNRNQFAKRNIPKSILILVLIFVLIQAVVLGTLAFLNDVPAPAVNSMTAGTIGVTVLENGTPDGFVPPGPGDTDADKEITIRNDGDAQNIPVYIRVALVPVFRTDANHYFGDVDDSKLSTDKALYATYNNTKFTLAINPNYSNDWFYKGGFFYYKQPLMGNTTTSALLQQVTIAPAVVGGTASWENFEVEVLTEAIQTDAAGSAGIAKWGVTRNSNGTLQA